MSFKNAKIQEMILTVWFLFLLGSYAYWNILQSRTIQAILNQ